MRRKMFGDYGMVLVLMLLCLLFSALTFKAQIPEGSDAITEIFEQISSRFDKSDIILVVGAAKKESALVAERVDEQLKEAGYNKTHAVVGTPRDLKLALDAIKAEGSRPAVCVDGHHVGIPVDHPARRRCGRRAEDDPQARGAKNIKGFVKPLEVITARGRFQPRPGEFADTNPRQAGLRHAPRTPSLGKPATAIAEPARGQVENAGQGGFTDIHDRAIVLNGERLYAGPGGVRQYPN